MTIGDVKITILLFSMISFVETGLTEEFPTTNVIASVVGYQTTRSVGPNIKTSFFSIDPADGNGEEKGVLFQVIAPVKYASKYFWMHHYGLSMSGKSSELYPPNLLYSFSFNNDTNDIMSITEANLFDISIYPPSICTLRPGGIPFFTKETEIDCEVKKLDTAINSISNEMFNAKIIAEKLDKKSKKYERYSRSTPYFEGLISSIEKEKKRLEDQRKLVTINASFIKLVTEQANDRQKKNVDPKHGDE